ncbi:MAG: TIGR01212 family radical SAM protein [Acidobacteria bacterium]|nr:TIGR01212 family radical SAM protein [Acidobacteriota bacterium]
MNPERDGRVYPGGRRYNAMAPYLRERFGCRVHKVSVDGGFTCPNRDGTVGVMGCTYCNNESFRPTGADRRAPIAEQVEQGIARLRRRFRARKFIVYFQPYTNTHAPLERLVPLYESALAHPDVIGLSVGTRPDCIDEGKLKWFETLAREKFVMVDYGLQSIHDTTLQRVNRGHDYRCWREAVSRSRGRGIWLGTHIILGFPWETREQILSMAPELSVSGVDSLKLHHLHIVRNTALARDYARNPFRLLGFDEYVELVVDFLERLRPGIRIERLLGEAPGDLLLGPDWGKSKAEVHRRIEQRLEERGTYQGCLWIDD